MRKVMLTVFFTGTRLLIMEALPKGIIFNQDYLLQSLLPALTDDKWNYSRKYRRATFAVRMDNAGPHKGAKVTAEM
jgi:hypothetical protein